MRPLRSGHAVLPMALFLGLWLSFSSPSIMVVQAATPSEPATANRSTLVDDNVAAEDDPDENLVPLDTEGPPPGATRPPPTTTSSVPRAEDLLQLNPAGRLTTTARVSDALDPPAGLIQTQHPSP